MHHPLLQPEIQQFIDANIGADVSKLALSKNPFPQTDWHSILNQIAAKSKAKDKLPTWFAADHILYPTKLSIEQTSSERTAAYKASLLTGKNLIDLTGGFGVDDFYFSKQFDQIVHCEINEDLSRIVKHNLAQLGVENIICETGDSTEILKRKNQQFDWIYIDPSRRNDAKGKVFMLKDCFPNVPDLLDFYFGYAQQIFIKTAPVLDIAAGLSELKNVKRIHIVALENEVKELLWEIEKGFSDAIQINTVNLLKSSEEHFDFVLDVDANETQFSRPLQYLYEPNAAIMKSGGFEVVGPQFNLQKLHRHSHLYTSDEPIDFPGRIFKIDQNLPYQKAEMKQQFENTKANITTRNFPDSVETIRKKWKIKDGGDRYCFFTTDQNNNKIALICTKIK